MKVRRNVKAQRLNYGVDLLVGAPFAGGGGGGGFAPLAPPVLLAGEAAAAGELAVDGDVDVVGDAAAAGDAVVLAPGMAAPSTCTRSLTA